MLLKSPLTLARVPGLQELLERYSKLRLAVEMANDKQVRYVCHVMAWHGWSTVCLRRAGLQELPALSARSRADPPPSLGAWQGML